MEAVEKNKKKTTWWRSTGEDFREIDREREMAPSRRGEYINVEAEGVTHVKGHVRGVGCTDGGGEAGSGWVNRNSFNVGWVGSVLGGLAKVNGNE